MTKIVLQVSMYCEKCKQRVMKAVSSIEGIDSLVVDLEKNAVTVIGNVDPIKLTEKLRKVHKAAQILTVEPEKEEKKGEEKVEKKEEKEEDQKPEMLPCCCRRCQTYYMILDPVYTYSSQGECNIL